MTKPFTLRNALALMSVRLVLEQIGLALLVFLLYALWLRVPDASVLDVVGSVSLALIIFWVAGAGESVLMLRLAGRARTPGRLLRGAVLVLLGAALWLGWISLIGHLRGDYNANDNLLAGYLNSRFPHQLRNFFSYPHILLWLAWIWTALEWIGAGIIAALVFAGTASDRPVRATVGALRSVAYWCAVVLVATGATLVTGLLMQWTPGHGLRVEMMSLVLRLSATVLVDASVACLVLAILAACIRRSDVSHSAPAGTPDESQPRTVDNP